MTRDWRRSRHSSISARARSGASSRRSWACQPIQLLQTRRLLLAKQLLTETRLPVTQIAFASGFSSLRRFNDAFNSRYGLAPTGLRKKAIDGLRQPGGGGDFDAATHLSTAL